MPTTCDLPREVLAHLFPTMPNNRSPVWYRPAVTKVPRDRAATTELATQYTPSPRDFVSYRMCYLALTLVLRTALRKWSAT